MRYAWGATLTLLLLACLAVWHISLLWLYRDGPSVLASWLMTIFVLVLATRQLARQVAPPARSFLMRHFARLDAVGLVFVAFLLLLLLLFHLGFERAASDGRSYFVQVRSLVMDWDLDFTNDEAEFGGHGAGQYAFGAPILWSPFFVVGHVWLSALNLLGGDLRVDGYYFPYQRAIGLGTLLYGFVGLVLIYRVLRKYFSSGLACLSTLGLCGSSFLIWYLTVDNSMVHGVSMFATTLFLFLWHRFRDVPTRVPWVWLGASAGVMAMVRWQNIAFVVLPLGDLLWSSWCARSGDSRTRLSAGGRDLVRFTGAAFAAFVPQLLFWKAVYGSWVYLPVREHAFEPTLLPPYLIDVLFSSNRGLLSWTPVISAALIGLVFFARHHGRVALVLAGGFLGQLWINGAVEIWWGGVGFGARRFANSALVFAVGLAGLLAAVQRRPLIAPVVTFCALLLFNTVFMLGYRNGTLSPTEGVAFDSVMDELYEHVGNPFSLPMGAYVAWRYDVGLPVYDRLRGRAYNNLLIDVGAPDDERFLGHGWAAREQHPSFTFRWADNETSTVLVPLKTNTDDYLLELEWGPFIGPGLPPQTVEIEVNSTSVATLTLQPGMHVDRVEIPAAVLRLNLNQLRFRYRYAVSPEELGLSGDTRRLSVQVATLRLQRLLKDS
ncbi:MAG: glycosyltransferase family 39 protein [Vicinamibacterales bacterium]|nr:hypothetical protein [Acidobacteriota bacterium]MDP7671729.1 glycosyltransferase family 39 protein [Vicinamibacterales bacterium]HJO39541.1 glycosyltransferase family 39 protein [Vicinamibacterales bacterium]